MRAVGFSGVCLLVAGVLAGCQAQPTKVEYWGGDNQAALGGLPLDVPLRIKVYGQDAVQSTTTTSGPGDTAPSDSFMPSEKPMAGVKVVFSVTSGGGSLSESTVTTDNEGFARTTWTIGTAGEQTAQASVVRDGNTQVLDSPRVFRATVVQAGTFTDPRDNEKYDTVTIGAQTWFAQNLRFNVPLSVTNPGFPDKSWGRFYTWELALRACPGGSHLPSDDEWTQLELLLGKAAITAGFLNNDNTYGRPMKSTTGWPAGVGSGTNSTGFNAFPTGTWLGAEALAPIGGETKFWTSYEEPKDPKYAWDRALVSDSTNLSNYGTLKVTGLPVRCVKN
jgi:uncharacterized protein (TIGR02145 family)